MSEKEHKFVNFRPLFYGFVAMLLALFTARSVFSGKIEYIIVDCVLVFGFSIFLFVRKKLLPLIVVLGCFLFGIGWYFVGLSAFEGREYTEVCQITGRLTDDLCEKEAYSVVTLQDVKINGHSDKNIYLTFRRGSDVLGVGDIVSFEAKLTKVKMFTLGSFNSTFYRKHTAYTAFANESDIIITGTKLTFAEKVRMGVQNALYKYMGKENGSVAYAVLFGDKRAIDSEVKDTYSTAGIVHILTVSGLHIGFLIALLGFVLKKCRVKGWINFVVNMIIVGLYAYLCGFSPAVVRASIMGLVLLFAHVSGKCYDNLNALGFAGIIILFINPLSALDIGFLMSFGCVFALFTLMPQVSNILSKFLPKRFADGIAVTFSAQIGVFPFISKMFGTINFLSIFTNMIVIPFFAIMYPLLFVFSFLSLGIGFFGYALSGIKYGFEFIYQIARVTSIDFFAIVLEPTTIYVAVAFFILLFLISKFFMTSQKVKAITCAVMFAVTGALFGLTYTSLPAESGVSIGYNLENKTILLTNNNKESVIIDVGEVNFAKSLMHASSVAKASATICLDRQNYENSLNLSKVYKYDSSQCWSSDTCVSVNTRTKCGGFEFEYVTFDDVVIGVDITFDHARVFVVSDSAKENQLVLVKDEEYDFVFVGKNVYSISQFSGAKNIVGYYQTTKTDQSYVKNGNIKYRQNKNGYEWRCID